MKKKVMLLAGLLILAAFQFGCRSVASPHTYLIMPDETLSMMEGTKVSARVSSVFLPVFLSRRELVRIVKTDEVTLVSGIILAETLDSNVRNVLSQNLERLSASNGAVKSVRFDFRHLEMTDRGTLRLEAMVIADGLPDSPKSFAFETPLAGHVHAVRAYSAALTELSRQVVQWVNQ